MLRVALRALCARPVRSHARTSTTTTTTTTTNSNSSEEPNSASPPQLSVKQVYKNLLHLGKDFPKGYEYFRDRCKSAFLKNRDVTDPHQIEVLLARAVYVTKELEALYMLKKYRTLKKRYYAEELK